MKKFDILRYLRRFFALVLAVTMAGTVVVYWYCKNNQTYTASVNIKYLHDGIKDGFAPDGTAMNVDEIYSSKVISQAMESLGLQSGINLVRSHCTVEELIPDDQKALQEALIDKGEESTYFPDEYKVTLVVDGSLGASYARRVLDAIVSSYSTIYTEEYVELPLTMNPSSGLLNSGYDYYECVDVLSSDTTEVLNYLEDKKTNYPNFRSSVTGYSYEDLYDIYKMLYDYEIPSLYANVMTGPQVRNADKLCRNLTQSIESSVQNEQVYQEREAYLSGLIQNYSEKNRDLINYHYHNDANDSGTDYILKNAASVIAMVINGGAYIAEIMRSGFQSIPYGLQEAGMALGMTSRQVFLNIRLKLALKNAFPALINQFILLFLFSSVTSTISMPELTYITFNLQSSTARVFEVLLISGAMYYVITILFVALFRKCEKKLFSW